MRRGNSNRIVYDEIRKANLGPVEKTAKKAIYVPVPQWLAKSAPKIPPAHSETNSGASGRWWPKGIRATN
jgi:hypothetical protein